ncbi:MAG TPA: family 16 glycoside hydrolase [Candidatus Eisenbacteria bacterium]
MKGILHTALIATPLALLAAIASAGGIDPTRDLRLPPTPKFTPPTSGVLFATDFSDGMRGWVPDRDSVWSVRNGSLRADLPDGRQLRSFIYAGSPSWTDYALDLDLLAARGVDKGAVVRVEEDSGIGVDLRGPGYQDVLLHRREWKMGRANIDNANGVWHHLRIEARGHRYRVYVDRELLIDREDARKARPRGRIALAAYTGGSGQCTVYYDNVVVTALSRPDVP